MRNVFIAAVATLVLSNGALADGDNKVGKSAKITADQAKEIALKAVPGTITDADLEKRKGKLFWYIDVQPNEGKFAKRQVRIDANAGNVTEIKDKDLRDVDAKVAKDSKQDKDKD